MIYEVTIKAPAINETVVLVAESEQAAKDMAISSAWQRQAEAATVTVRIKPE